MASIRLSSAACRSARRRNDEGHRCQPRQGRCIKLPRSCASSINAALLTGDRPIAGDFPQHVGLTFIAPGKAGSRRRRVRPIPPASPFVDFAGQRVDVIDGSSGEFRLAQILVAVMAPSNLHPSLLAGAGLWVLAVKSYRSISHDRRPIL